MFGVEMGLFCVLSGGFKGEFCGNLNFGNDVRIVREFVRFLEIIWLKIGFVRSSFLVNFIYFLI